MLSNIKENLVLYTAFAVPVVIIVIVALVSFLPSFFLNTDYDFLYATCSVGSRAYSYSCGEFLQTRYSVVDGKLRVDQSVNIRNAQDEVVENPEKYDTRVFLHDSFKNESREISIARAQQLVLDPLITSPDGVTLSSGYRDGPSFFPLYYVGSEYGYFLKKGARQKRMNLVNTGRYESSFKFLGWVVNGEGS